MTGAPLSSSGSCHRTRTAVLERWLNAGIGGGPGTAGNVVPNAEPDQDPCPRTLPARTRTAYSRPGRRPST